KVLHALLGASWRKQAIEFAHHPAAPPGAYQSQFGCPVRFGAAQTALVFPAACLAQAPRGGNEPHYQTLHDALEAEHSAARHRLDLQNALEAWIAAGLTAGASTEAEHAASDFGMSLRSLQRRLGAAQVNFAALRNEVRGRLARALLQDTDLPVTAIGERLGYSETSAFSRAFTRRHGVSPAAYRQRPPATRP
ncbi:AraC family transcriptional regulator, partial [Acidocella sp.]